MDEALTKEEQIARGSRAAEILESSVFQEAVEDAKAALIDVWLASDDRDDQFAARAAVLALGTVEQQLRRYVSQGQFAAEVVRRSQV